MQFKTYPLPGGGELDVYLRTPAPAMPNALRRPLVLVVPGGGYEHVSAREADPVALQFAAAGYHAAVLTYSVGEGARNYQPAQRGACAAAGTCGGVGRPAGTDRSLRLLGGRASGPVRGCAGPARR